ncbi:multiple cyclophane-containing RiPP AmcA [Streptoverticillium reticulum]|uniref:multiple cyclophane-containing RiPP AmcA n=1 Tax=Streptoverticillium reticulum TaxID=1433415 RepID=UPI0039BFC7F2
MSTPTATDLVTAAADGFAALLASAGPAVADGGKFDNRPTWDNAKPPFDNRPTWDNWDNKNKKK